jgi:glucose uptake protein
MFLPNTYISALLLTILSMICWGSWANTQKLAGKWRFELFYYDYAFGVLVAAVIAAFTLGSMNSAELSFFDNLLIAGYRKMAFAVAAGVIFNLANMLLVAAIALSGLAVAFPVGIGLAMVIGVIANYLLNPQGNPMLLLAGGLLVVVAIVVDAMAYGAHAGAKVDKPKDAKAAAKAAQAKKSRTTKGIVISLVCGVLMGSFYPLVEISQSGDIGLAPYSCMLLFAAGVFLSTFVFNLFFMNLPVEGPPIGMLDYFKGTARRHLLGIAGGAIWCAGALSNFLAASTPREVNIGPAISYAIGQGATLVSALWGLLLWKEFAGATSRVKTLLVLMIALFVAGLTLLSIAPLYGK